MVPVGVAVYEPAGTKQYSEAMFGIPLVELIPLDIGLRDAKYPV